MKTQRPRQKDDIDRPKRVTQKELALVARQTVLPLRPIIAVDPGATTSGFARFDGNGDRIDSGVIRKASVDLMAKVQKLGWDRGAIGVLEDMPPGFFKSHKASASFHAMRARWTDVLRALGCSPILSIHVSTWRRVSGVYDCRELVPKKAVRVKDSAEYKQLPDYKLIARFFLESRGLLTEDMRIDEVEAICLGRAAVKMIRTGFFAEDGKPLVIPPKKGKKR